MEIIGQHRKQEINKIFSGFKRAYFYSKSEIKRIERINEKRVKAKKSLIKYRPVSVPLPVALRALFKVLNSTLRYNAQYPNKLYYQQDSCKIVTCNGSYWELV